MTASKKNPAFKQFGSVWVGFLVFFAIVGIIAYLFYISDNAKPGDLLYPLDQTVEWFDLNFNSVTPETRMVVEQNLAKERLNEALALQQENKNHDLFKITMDNYNNEVTGADLDYKQTKARVGITAEQNIQYVGNLLDNLELLYQIYINSDQSDNDYLTQIIENTAAIYNRVIIDLENNQGDTDQMLDLKTRFYDIQQELEVKGILI